jgi:anaerobic selenocysteine-containing dehydrogenase
MADEILSGELRALFCLGGNPATVFPDAAKTERAMRALELLVVCDVQPSETTALATHVLPVCGQLERPDIPLAADSIFPFPFTQYTEAVVEPVGDRRPMFRVFSEIGERLGIPLFGDTEVDRMLRESGPTADAIIGLVAGGSRVPWDVMRTTPGGVVPDDPPGPGWLVPDALPGPIELAPEDMRVQLAEWASRAAPADESLVLLNRRLPRTSNSVLRDSRAQRARGPAPSLWMHSDDAARLRLSDGVTVEVATETGTTRAVVELTDLIRPGAVSLPHGWSTPCVNALTSTRAVDPITGMPRYSGFPVTLRLVSD